LELTLPAHPSPAHNLCGRNGNNKNKKLAAVLAKVYVQGWGGLRSLKL